MCSRLRMMIFVVLWSVLIGLTFLGHCKAWSSFQGVELIMAAYASFVLIFVTIVAGLGINCITDVDMVDIVKSILTRR